MTDPATHPLHYVVLHHAGIEHPHHDLLFETAVGSPLAAWRAQRWPVEDGDGIAILPDHRRAYLEYEGPISGNRGQVRRVHAGRHAVLANEDAALLVELEDGAQLRLPRAALGAVHVSRRA